MRKNWLLIIVIIILVLLVGGFIFARINRNRIINASIDKIESIYKKNVYTLFYKGERNDDIDKALKAYISDYKIKVYYLTDDFDKVKEYYEAIVNEDIESDTIFAIYDQEGNKEVIYNDRINYTSEYIKKVMFNYVPTLERNYKLSTASQYISMLNSKDLTISVFAEDKCSYCNMLEPVINEVAKEIDKPIYYYNPDRMDEDEYKTIMNVDLTIPGSCTTQGIETSFKKDFAKPMTLVTKAGKVVGCIKGYYKKDVYLEYLKEILEG